MAQRKGKLLPLILVIVGIFFFVRSKIHVEREAAPEMPDEADAAALTAEPSYALDARMQGWPPIAEGAANAATQASGVANYYLVLDGSGSMTRSECSGEISKIEAAVNAIATFIGSVPAEANVGLLIFDGNGIAQRAALSAGDRTPVKNALAQVRAEGATPLKSAITQAYEKLTDQARLQLGYGEYHLVVVTDGAPQPASQDPTPIVKQILAESPVIIHTIGFCLDTDHVLNQPGRTLYLAADSPEELAQGLDSVLAEAPAFDVTQFGQ